MILADPALPHQIVIFIHGGHKIAVSCNCLRTGGDRGPATHKPIESRTRWDWPDMRTAYLNWHALEDTA